MFRGVAPASHRDTVDSDAINRHEASRWVLQRRTNLRSRALSRDVQGFFIARLLTGSQAFCNDFLSLEFLSTAIADGYAAKKNKSLQTDSAYRIVNFVSKPVPPGYKSGRLDAGYKPPAKTGGADAVTRRRDAEPMETANVGGTQAKEAAPRGNPRNGGARFWGRRNRSRPRYPNARTQITLGRAFGVSGDGNATTQNHPR